MPLAKIERAGDKGFLEDLKNEEYNKLTLELAILEKEVGYTYKSRIQLEMKLKRDFRDRDRSENHPHK